MITKEDYVSLETAKILKEKGYNEATAGFYSNIRGLCVGTAKLYNSIKNNFEFVSDDFKVLSETRISAPTLYEAQKWLREKYNLHISMYSYGDYLVNEDGHYDGIKMYWAFDIYYLINLLNFTSKQKEEYDSYEQALDAGIQKALTFI